MKSLDEFERLARTARAEPVPAIDVSGSVLRRLRTVAVPRRWDRMSMWIAAGISVMAASAVISLVLDEWLPMVDPLAGLFQSMTLVML